MADFECGYPTFVAPDVASWFWAGNNYDNSLFYQAPAEQPSYDSTWLYQALAAGFPIQDFPIVDEVRPTTSTSTILGGFNITPDVSEMRRVFDKFDRHGDGLICSQALRRFMSRLGYHLTQNEAQKMLEKVDGNQDGRIDFSEFLSLYRSLCDGEETTTSSITTVSIPPSHASTACASTPTSTSMEMGMEIEMEMEVQRLTGFEDDSTLLEAFRVFDKNQDGVITAQELQSVLLDLGMPEGRSLRSCEQMIESVDADGNGVIDIAEFRQLMTTSFGFC